MGQTYFKVEGLNLNYLIDKVHKEKIDILNLVKKNDRVIEFSVKNRDKLALVALLKELCYNVTTLRETGKPKVLGFLVSRAALFAGLIVFIISAVFY
ncbi:MAG: sporulation protein YqfD, partial [Firmicutes bacterium]|nr:sporulation protein YqfD [Bacillota bacterium]